MTTDPLAADLKAIADSLRSLAQRVRRLEVKPAGGSGTGGAGVAEGPGIDLVPNAPNPTDIGLGLDSILLVKADGSPCAEFGTLTDACAAAQAGEIIWIARAGTFSEDINVPDGVMLAGFEKQLCIIAGTVGLGEESVLTHVSILHSTIDPGDLTGVLGPVQGVGYLYDVIIAISKQGGGGNADGLLTQGGDLLAWDCDILAETVAGLGYGANAANGNIVVLEGRLDGSTARAFGDIAPPDQAKLTLDDFQRYGHADQRPFITEPNPAKPDCLVQFDAPAYAAAQLGDSTYFALPYHLYCNPRAPIQAGALGQIVVTTKLTAVTSTDQLNNGVDSHLYEGTPAGVPIPFEFDPPRLVSYNYWHGDRVINTYIVPLDGKSFTFELAQWNTESIPSDLSDMIEYGPHGYFGIYHQLFGAGSFWETVWESEILQIEWEHWDTSDPDPANWQPLQPRILIWDQTDQGMGGGGGGLGHVYVHAVQGTPATGEVPLEGDRSAWDAAAWPLLHANDIDTLTGIHHTLGSNPTQAAPGDHTHDFWQAHIIQDEGVDLPQQFRLNFVGDGVTVTDDDPNGTTVVTIPGAPAPDGPPHVIQDEGVPLAQELALNFVGAGVTITDDAGNGATVVTIPGAAGGQPHVIQDEGIPLAQQPNLNFAGAGVTVTNDAGNSATLVTIPGGAGGADPSKIWLLDGVGLATQEFDPDDAGLALALAAATSGDIVLVPPASFSAAHSVPTLVSLVGRDKQACIFTGEITLGDGALLNQLSLVITSAGAASAMVGPASGETAQVQDCLIAIEADPPIVVDTSTGGDVELIDCAVSCTTGGVEVDPPTLYAPGYWDFTTDRDWIFTESGRVGIPSYPGPIPHAISNGEMYISLADPEAYVGQWFATIYGIYTFTPSAPWVLGGGQRDITLDGTIDFVKLIMGGNENGWAKLRVYFVGVVDPYEYTTTHWYNPDEEVFHLTATLPVECVGLTIDYIELEGYGRGYDVYFDTLAFSGVPAAPGSIYVYACSGNVAWAIPLAGDRAAQNAALFPDLHTNDTDFSPLSLHHTLGTGINQAAHGSHSHINEIEVQLHDASLGQILPYTTLAAAVADAQPGDTIQIPLGTITGNVLLPAGVMLTGQARNASIIDGSITPGDGCVIENLSVAPSTNDNGVSAKGVIVPAGVSVVLNNVSITPVNAGLGGANGILAMGNGSLVQARNCYVKAQTAGGDFYDLFIVPATTARIDARFCYLASTQPANTDTNLYLYACQLGVDPAVYATPGTPALGDRAPWNHRHVMQLAFTVSGELTVAADPIKYWNETDEDKTFTKVKLGLGTGPVGAAVIVDIHSEGVTIFTNQAHRPQIADGATEGFTTAIDLPTWTAGNDLEMFVDQTGIGTKGSNLTVIVVYY